MSEKHSQKLSFVLKNYLYVQDKNNLNISAIFFNSFLGTPQKIYSSLAHYYHLLV